MITMDGQIPADGYTYAYETNERLSVKRPLQFSAGVKALTPFLKRFSFFTIAPLYLWGDFDECVLSDFQSRLRGVEFFHTKFDKPLFRGLELPNGDTDWNYVLWAVEQEHWQPFVDHICSSVMHDTPRKRVSKFGLQYLEIMDPLVVDRSVLIPGISLVTIGAFGVRNDRFQLGFVPPSNPLQPYGVMMYPPDAECQQYAKLLATSDPIAATQQLAST